MPRKPQPRPGAPLSHHTTESGVLHSTRRPPRTCNELPGLRSQIRAGSMPDTAFSAMYAAHQCVLRTARPYGCATRAGDVACRFRSSFGTRLARFPCLAARAVCSESGGCSPEANCPQARLLPHSLPAPDRRLLVSSLTQREASTTEGGADAMSPHQEGVHLVAQEGPYAASTSHLPVLQVSAGIGTGRAASAPSPCNCTMQARMRNPGQKLRGRASSSLPQPPARPNSTSQHAAAPRPSGARRQAGTTSGGRRARPRSLGQGDRS